MKKEEKWRKSSEGKKVLTDALISVINGDMLEDGAPVRASKMGLHPRAGDDVHSVLGVVQRLQHDDEGRTGVSLLVHAGAVVMELNGAAMVLLRHFVHHPAEPLEGSLLPRDPVEVRPLRRKRLLSLRRSGGLGVFLIVGGGVVEDVLDDADQRGGADAEPHEEDDVVFLVVLRWGAVGAVNEEPGEAGAAGSAINAVCSEETALVGLHRLANL